MYNCDLHILTTGGSEWLPELLESLQNEPCNIHIVKGIEGDLGQSRANGFNKGCAKYVTFADHDDIVMTGVIQQCVNLLDSHPEATACYTDQLLIDESGNILHEGWSSRPELFEGRDIRLARLPDGRHAHHLLVARRSCIDYAAMESRKRIVEPFIVHSLMQQGSILHLPVIGYKWRIHGKGISATYTTPEIDEAVRELSENSLV